MRCRNCNPTKAESVFIRERRTLQSTLVLAGCYKKLHTNTSHNKVYNNLIILAIFKKCGLAIELALDNENTTSGNRQRNTDKVSVRYMLSQRYISA